MAKSFKGNNPYQLAEQSAEHWGSKSKSIHQVNKGLDQLILKGAPAAADTALKAEEQLGRTGVREADMAQKVTLKHNAVRSRPLDMCGEIVHFDSKGIAKVSPTIMPRVREWMRARPGRVRIVETPSPAAKVDKDELREKAFAAMAAAKEVADPEPTLEKVEEKKAIKQDLQVALKELETKVEEAPKKPTKKRGRPKKASTKTETKE